jgi:guanyl-specific ribonuclease Sa
MKRINWKVPATALLALITLVGCGKTEISEDTASSENEALAPASAAIAESGAVAAETASDNYESSAVAETLSDNSDSSVGAETTTERYDVVSADEDSSKALIDEYGIYDSKDEVALYIVTYDKLPSNYITKKEAKKLGWSGGSLESYAPGKCIGGDYFGNYEGNLPEDAQYHECDIDTLGKKSRGAKRIVYSDDGYIYYTEDHYETFELLYEP